MARAASLLKTMHIFVLLGFGLSMTSCWLNYLQYNEYLNSMIIYICIHYFCITWISYTWLEYSCLHGFWLFDTFFSGPWGPGIRLACQPPLKPEARWMLKSSHSHTILGQAHGDSDFSSLYPGPDQRPGFLMCDGLFVCCGRLWL